MATDGSISPSATSVPSTFPGPTVARLKNVHALLQSLRDGIVDGMDNKALRGIVDQITPEIFEAITEVQTGPSLMDQFAARLGIELADHRAQVELASQKQRDDSILKYNASTVALANALNLKLPAESATTP